MIPLNKSTMTNLQEIWLPVPIKELQHKYLVSNLGNIKNIKTGLVKELVIISNYFYIGFSVGNREARSYRVNRLVAKAFVPNPDNLPVVRHLDDNKLNNNALNLQWGTHQDNMDDMTGRERQAKGERAGASKLTEQDVIKIRLLRAGGMSYDDIVPLFSVNKSTICTVCNRKSWRHVA